MSVFIFGDSFFADISWHKDSWPVKLAESEDVINYAAGGYSNHNIYLSFLDAYQNMKEGDVVIVGWTEPNRFYCNDSRRVQYARDTYFSYLHNNTLQDLYYKTYMSEIERMCKDKGCHLLVFWAFPSKYDIPMENPVWNLKQVGELSYDKYLYTKTFENEVRPALLYFSWADFDKSLPENELASMFANDNRPNHIADQKVHDEILKIIKEFIETKSVGAVDLIKRLENG